ncbi:zinc transporter ZupT [Desulfomicrobium escambiense]|uniref:zinc transporter ZupT n=1 Tax=Desulfomicrobium escambiense TaxID=29503 RepID=UPI0004150CAE|nr:zinc transporter ZupT [Desulfomicrobium escambiense]
MSEVWFALGLTAFAGLATGIGSIIAFTAKLSSYRFLSVATGFSAGVMLYVSFVEIFFKGQAVLVGHYGDPLGHWVNAAAFFGGMLVIGLIDNFIPEEANPHEIPPEAEADKVHGKSSSLWEITKNSRTPSTAPAQPLPGYEKKLMRMGLFTALAIGIHNLPEGLATFLAALQDPQLGVAIAVAVALHNIPEGVSVSVPIYFATGKRRKAFLYSFLSGLAEPVGAGIAYLAILFFAGGPGGVLPPQLTGILFGGVAGIMVYISLDELLPTSRAYGQGHDSLFGLLGGMVVMALSLLLMR